MLIPVTSKSCAKTLHSVEKIVTLIKTLSIYLHLHTCISVFVQRSWAWAQELITCIASLGSFFMHKSIYPIKALIIVNVSMHA